MGNPNIKLVADDRPRTRSIVLACFQGSRPETGRLEKRLAGAMGRLGEDRGWRALPDQVGRTVLGGAQPRSIEVDGLGRRSEFDDRSLDQWLLRALARSRLEGRTEITLILPDASETRGRASLRVLTRILQSGYRFGPFKPRPKAPPLRTVYVIPPTGEDGCYRRALPLARRLAKGVGVARDLGNTPPNVASPQWMANEAAGLADRLGLDCQVLDVAALEEKKMGGILAVGAGSSHPPRLVRLEWGDGDRVTSFVGKGITFDTGGISIKPSATMEEMKFDKCGACTVLGIVEVLAAARIPGRYRAYLPLAENMPDGASYRPSDIVRCYNGKSVEIINTDAEGRMILADALAWAAEEKPESILELSTLTGATVLALGHEGAALYSPSDELAGELLAAADSSGDRLWRMPLWAEFGEKMKGTHARLKNLGSRWGGANQAAAFLSEFVGRTQRWAHLDIAGTAYRSETELGEVGATGFGVALTVDWLLQRTETF